MNNITQTKSWEIISDISDLLKKLRAQIVRIELQDLDKKRVRKLAIAREMIEHAAVHVEEAI